MGKINILSNSLANKIAAGEVVERPASVVKELLENSIDAGSTNIKIIIKEFGIEEIRIIDNGSGIANDDIEKAFMRHATSKINNDYDLFHINTLGFRGEALASIASVSNIEIKSCAGEEQGKILELQAGKITKNEYYAPIKGTDISVKNLFYNTPARLKYLKNPHTEQANIMNIINKLALSYPSISFEVSVDGKIVLKTYGDKDRHKVISKIYNVAVAKNMLSFYGNNDDYKINGYISKPDETRANKNYITIFINGRYIKNYAIQNAIVDAYGTFLMKNRYPIAIINIEMDSVLIDVNVHPTKQEVRLSKESELIQLIKATIESRLANNTYIPEGINNVIRKKEIPKIEQLSYDKELDSKFVVKENNYPNTTTFSGNSYRNTKLEEDIFEKQKENFFDFIKPVEKNSDISFENDYINDNSEYNNKIEKHNDLIELEFVEDTELLLPQLKVLAQIFKTYILAETGNELYLIDQHAAQERYNYEKIQKTFFEKSSHKNQLLIPITYNFFNEEEVKIKNIVNKLAEIGIDLQEFGENNYIVREYPGWIKEDAENIIKDIIEKLSVDSSLTASKLADDAIAMASCKASIKANQYLTHEEMNKVIEDLYSCKNPFTCPHGRPIISKMTKKDLEKMFKRIV